jgi:hypothetical protein
MQGYAQVCRYADATDFWRVMIQWGPVALLFAVIGSVMLVGAWLHKKGQL